MIIDEKDMKCPVCGANDFVSSNPEETEFTCMKCGNTFTEEQLKAMNYE